MTHLRDHAARGPKIIASGKGAVIKDLACQRGVYLRPTMEVVGLAPPLTISEKQLDRMVAVPEEVIPIMDKKLR